MLCSGLGNPGDPSYTSILYLLYAVYPNYQIHSLRLEVSLVLRPPTPYCPKTKPFFFFFRRFLMIP